jgi:REP-associated tyrosine transposase
LGRTHEGTMKENRLGRIVRACWMEIPHHFTNVELDAFVVMPNHVHGLIHLKRMLEIPRERNTTTEKGHDVSCPCKSPSEQNNRRKEAFGKPVVASLATIVRTFKAAVTREARRMLGRPQMEVWQRNYFERVVRDDHEYADTHRYIRENPLRWETDVENPESSTAQEKNL